ncbi:MAG: protein TolR [Alphaproteobacteria bacterium]|nr:protein TolR [Alphaproteobacteria bacterium]
MGATIKFRETSGKRRGSYRPMADINVTPFVDVMLVLLIVFMVAAPLLTSGVPVDLPNSEATPIPDEDNKPLEITINDEGEIYIGETLVKFERLVAMLEAMTNSDPDRRVYIRGDQNLSYGQVMEIIGAINAAGFRKVALISEASIKKP